MGARTLEEVLENVILTDGAVDHRSGRLSFSESGDLHLSGDVAVRAIEIAFELLGWHLDLQPNGVPAGLLDGGLHAVSSVPEIGVTTVPSPRLESAARWSPAPTTKRSGPTRPRAVHPCRKSAIRNPQSAIE